MALPVEVVEELKDIVGSPFISADGDVLRQYGQDETEDLLFLPDLVVRPGTTAEVAQVLRLANRRRIPVTPRGGGTGLSGGALPARGGVVLAMERFNRILTIDRENFQVTVEPGVITQKLQEELEAVGLYFPPDPASRGSSQIGGNLAECSGGPHAVKYGVTRDYVLALQAVLPTGEVIATGAPVLKNVTGYNLSQLLIGSEGTLAVITRVTFRLLPLPRYRKVLLVAFATLESAAAAVAAIFQAGVTPAALEFMERSAVQAAEVRLGKHFPNGDAGAQLLIEVDGSAEEVLQADVLAVADTVNRFGAVDVLLAEERQKIEDVWALRRSIGEAVKGISAYKEEDTVVPRAQLPKLVSGVKKICSRYGITSICYGHAGDGNVHVNILKEGLDDATWEANLDRAVREIFELTVTLGGTISGEHGIGYSQKAYLPIAVGPVERRLMADIKRAFDPNGILNPGKILPG